LKKCGCGLDLSDSGEERVVRSNEPSSLLEGGEFLD
jgi:hypothetical protein